MLVVPKRNSTTTAVVATAADVGLRGLQLSDLWVRQTENSGIRSQRSTMAALDNRSASGCRPLNPPWTPDPRIVAIVVVVVVVVVGHQLQLLFPTIVEGTAATQPR